MARFQSCGRNTASPLTHWWKKFCRCCTKSLSSSLLLPKIGHRLQSALSPNCKSEGRLRCFYYEKTRVRTRIPVTVRTTAHQNRQPPHDVGAGLRLCPG